MKFLRVFIFLLLCLVPTVRAEATITILSHTSQAGSGASAAINTTGATDIVAYNQTSGPCTITDSQSNAWVTVADKTGGQFGGGARMMHVNTPSTSASHTFTGCGSLFGMWVVALSVTDTSTPLDVFGTSGSPINATVTPTNPNSIVITGTGGGSSVLPMSINQGFTILESIAGAGGVSYGADLAYLLETTAVAANPSWDDNGNNYLVLQNGLSIIAVFNAGGGGPPACTPPASQLTTVGVGNCKQ